MGKLVARIGKKRRHLIRSYFPIFSNSIELSMFGSENFDFQHQLNCYYNEEIIVFQFY